MFFLIAFVLLLINLITSLIYNKLINKIFINLLLLLIWILFWGNYYNADYANYLYRYNYTMNSGLVYPISEIGFGYLMKISTILNLEYHHFLLMFSFIGLSLINSTIQKYSNKPQLVYVLYFIFPFMLDLVQIRHFMSMAIIVFSLRYLEDLSHKNKFKFIICIIIAFSMHYISIIFLPIVFIDKIKTNSLYFIMFILILILFILIYSNSLSKIINYFIPIYKTQYYLLNKVRLGFIFEIFFQGIMLLEIHNVNKFFKAKNIVNKFVNIVYKINIYLLILCPLYTLHVIFGRTLRIMMIPNYIVLTNKFSELNKNTKIFFLFSLLLLSVSLFFWHIFPVRETVFYPIFQKNLLF